MVEENIASDFQRGIESRTSADSLFHVRNVTPRRATTILCRTVRRCYLRFV